MFIRHESVFPFHYSRILYIIFIHDLSSETTDTWIFDCTDACEKFGTVLPRHGIRGKEEETFHAPRVGRINSSVNKGKSDGLRSSRIASGKTTPWELESDFLAGVPLDLSCGISMSTRVRRVIQRGENGELHSCNGIWQQ